MSVRTAYQDVRKSLIEVNAIAGKRADALRTMENERLDRYLRALQPAIDVSARRIETCGTCCPSGTQ